MPPPDSPDPPQVLAWERRTNAPLTALAVLMVVAYAFTVLIPDMPSWAHNSLITLDITIWALFAVDYFGRLSIAGRHNRVRFVRNNLLDLTVVLVPPARPLRLLRAVVMILEAFNRYSRTVTRPRSRLTVFVTGITVLMLFLSSLAILDAERDAPGSNVQNFGDAAWWSVVSVTTVGYGDISPVTTQGRIVALVLMFGGIGLIGFITGSLASWMVEKFGSDAAKADQRDVDNRELLAEVRALRAEVAALRTGEASSVAQGGESVDGT